MVTTRSFIRQHFDIELWRFINVIITCYRCQHFQEFWLIGMKGCTNPIRQALDHLYIEHDIAEQ
jgi:hypothetical protein